MAIIIKTHLLLFILLISTLLLASSATPLTIRRTRILGDRVQKCKLPICIAIYNNSKSYKDPRDEYFHCWQSCQTREAPEEWGVECGRCLDKKLMKQALGKKQHTEEEAEEEETEPSADFNPYYFPRYMLKPRFVAEQGGYFVLDRFARLSKLLRGAVENYRFAVFQAAPGTFVLPHHIDAESIFVVWSGKGAVALVMKDKKELFEIKDGDVIRVPAGATTYFINDHKSDVLSLTQLIQPVNIPDQFEEFFLAGYGAVNSYFSIFSNDILEAAFDIPGEQLEKAFGRQRTEGMIIKAPEEQLGALSKQASPPWWRKLIPWWSMESDSKFSLQGQKPVYSNDYGRFFEFTPQEFKQLKDIHASFALADIKPGAMMVPHYNSKATYLVMVVNGTGWFEMVSPQFTIPETSEEMEDQEEQNGQFIKVNCKLSLGDVFVIPAGHPVAIVAQNNNDGSPNQNLIMIGFGINAENNMRNFLAGQEGNIMKQIEREAMQLAFGQEMEQILNNQNQSYFVPMTEKSRQQQHKEHREGRSHP